MKSSNILRSISESNIYLFPVNVEHFNKKYCFQRFLWIITPHIIITILFYAFEQQFCKVPLRKIKIYDLQVWNFKYLKYRFYSIFPRVKIGFYCSFADDESTNFIANEIPIIKSRRSCKFKKSLKTTQEVRTSQSKVTLCSSFWNQNTLSIAIHE